MPLEIKFSPNFVKKLKKYKQKKPEIALSFQKKFVIFQNNPRDSRLKTHKLSGRLNGAFAFSVFYDIRAVFTWEGQEVVFRVIGTHDEAY
jgi:mRNA-degrading endonuclease YafQ of YafQ-DinJ toxin-antitoxin module